jgi:hypothetical protein
MIRATSNALTNKPVTVKAFMEADSWRPARMKTPVAGAQTVRWRGGRPGKLGLLPE